MALAENLNLTIPDNCFRDVPGMTISPELVLLSLERLQKQQTSGGLDPSGYLGQRELQTYHQFKYPKRQIEWLGGRLAAKQAGLRLKKQEPTGSKIRETEIYVDEHGKPLFKSVEGKSVGLSISHSHGLALAMAVYGKDCGVDIQKISATTIRVKEKFCSGAEEQLVASLDLPNYDQAAGLTLLWAAKEALRKALGGHPLTGFTAMVLIEARQPSSFCQLFTLDVNGEKHMLPAFFYRDYAIAHCSL